MYLSTGLNISQWIHYRGMDWRQQFLCAELLKVKWDNCHSYNETDQAERNKFQIVPISPNPKELLTELYPGEPASANLR